jgi:hypothetical protein
MRFTNLINGGYFKVEVTDEIMEGKDFGVCLVPVWSVKPPKYKIRRPTRN